jgi:hypothetical protein
MKEKRKDHIWCKASQLQQQGAIAAGAHVVCTWDKEHS